MRRPRCWCLSETRTSRRVCGFWFWCNLIAFRVDVFGDAKWVRMECVKSGFRFQLKVLISMIAFVCSRQHSHTNVPLSLRLSRIYLCRCFLCSPHTSLGLGLPGRAVAVAALFVAAVAQSSRHRSVERVCRSEWYGYRWFKVNKLVAVMIMQTVVIV